MSVIHNPDPCNYFIEKHSLNHLQQAQAIASHILEMKVSQGWSAGHLTPLLAGLLALLPWLKQWHNEVDPLFGTGMGD